MIFFLFDSFSECSFHDNGSIGNEQRRRDGWRRDKAEQTVSERGEMDVTLPNEDVFVA